MSHNAKVINIIDSCIIMLSYLWILLVNILKMERDDELGRIGISREIFLICESYLD